MAFLAAIRLVRRRASPHCVSQVSGLTKLFDAGGCQRDVQATRWSSELTGHDRSSRSLGSIHYYHRSLFSPCNCVQPPHLRDSSSHGTGTAFRATKSSSPKREDAMSSTARISRQERAMRSLSGLKYGDFLMKSMPYMAVAFILYLVLQGTFW